MNASRSLWLTGDLGGLGPISDSTACFKCLSIVGSLLFQVTFMTLLLCFGPGTLAVWRPTGAAPRRLLQNAKEQLSRFGWQPWTLGLLKFPVRLISNVPRIDGIVELKKPAMHWRTSGNGSFQRCQLPPHIRRGLADIVEVDAVFVRAVVKL
jgi:hypothetical protein